MTACLSVCHGVEWVAFSVVIKVLCKHNQPKELRTQERKETSHYEDKQITCDYFDVDMQTNMAIAYNNVVVTDPQSIMKAGKIILNIETKVININPDNKKNKVKVTIN